MANSADPKVSILSGMANSVNPDQTTLSGAVWSESVLFAYGIFPELWYANF